MEDGKFTLDVDVVLEIHQAVIKEGPGVPGLSAERPLESVLARVENRILFGELQGLFEIAAFYAETIATGHPFVDGNKRTAFAVMAIILDRNGYRLPETPELEDKIVALAKREIDFENLARWIETNVQPFEP